VQNVANENVNRKTLPNIEIDTYGFFSRIYFRVFAVKLPATCTNIGTRKACIKRPPAGLSYDPKTDHFAVVVLRSSAIRRFDDGPTTREASSLNITGRVPAIFVKYDECLPGRRRQYEHGTTAHTVYTRDTIPPCPAVGYYNNRTIRTVYDAFNDVESL